MKPVVKLPVGIENFEEIRTEGFYYVDKTDLIRDLLNNWGKVNLFTRPRRFGKSLNMSMLKYFLEYGCDSRLFDGLKISEDQELCQAYMGKFPVISISLKDACAREFKAACGMLRSVIRSEAFRFPFLKESTQLMEEEREIYRQLIRPDGGFCDSLSEETLTDSLGLLCRLLHKHYGQKAVLLIDEYDVPLDKAQQYGYYEEMTSLIRNLFSRALKSNDSLQFAVLTGCLRIAKESIFTGLNNLKVLSVTNDYFDDCFGFSDHEVRSMLEFYGLADKYNLVKTWYDGYRFGNADVYCPWDVISYVDLLRADPEASPQAFWTNTSGNDIIRNFLQKATPVTKREIEQLIAGECIIKKINQELTYRDLYSNIDNLWSVLFTTGYLTQRGKPEGKMYRLGIPNLEIREIFIEQIQEWFQEETRKDTPKLDALCAAFQNGDAQTAEKLFGSYLASTISIRDTNARKAKKEHFYHGILIGLLSHREDWDLDSNAESGDGYSDIQIEIWEKRIGIVIEVKYPDNGDLEAGCRQALAQIEDKAYETRLRQDGMETILKYGIACSKKRCKIQKRNMEEKTS